GEGSRQSRADRSAARALRPRRPRRTRLPAVQRLRRRIALPSAEQALRADQRHYHHQSQLRRVGDRVRRPEDDDRAPRSAHPPLSYPRNRKRQLPFQEQLGKSRQTHKGETSQLDERLNPKPSSSRVNSQWKSRVKSRRKSTPRSSDHRMTPSRAQFASTFVLSGSRPRRCLVWPRRAFSFEACATGEAMRGGEVVSRRLAAIVAANVAGYSRLIEARDAGTLAGLNSL